MFHAICRIVCAICSTATTADPVRYIHSYNDFTSCVPYAELPSLKIISSVCRSALTEVCGVCRTALTEVCGVCRTALTEVCGVCSTALTEVCGVCRIRLSTSGQLVGC